jgi:D-ribose pyranase
VKKKGVLNKDISEVVASLGHLDKLTICDAGLPIPDDVWRIDLAVSEGIPGFIEVTKVLAEDVKVQKIIMAEEIKVKSPQIEAKVIEIFKGVEVVYVPHDKFKEMSVGSRAIIRTGEFTPYANVIIVSGVMF